MIDVSQFVDEAEEVCCLEASMYNVDNGARRRLKNGGMRFTLFQKSTGYVRVNFTLQLDLDEFTLEYAEWPTVSPTTSSPTMTQLPTYSPTQLPSYAQTEVPTSSPTYLKSAEADKVFGADSGGFYSYSYDSYSYDSLDGKMWNSESEISSRRHLLFWSDPTAAPTYMKSAEADKIFGADSGGFYSYSYDSYSYDSLDGKMWNTGSDDSSRPTAGPTPGPTAVPSYGPTPAPSYSQAPTHLPTASISTLLVSLIEKELISSISSSLNTSFLDTFQVPNF